MLGALSVLWIVLAEVSESLATNDALGSGGSASNPTTCLPHCPRLPLDLLPTLGVLPRLGSNSAQPKGCLVGETCVVELLEKSTLVSGPKFALTAGNGDMCLPLGTCPLPTEFAVAPY